jgi:nitrite reductase/ring-hydroxylating ferredoxin subunit/alkylhydroperoxidase/carboxymuconolactone decarboxylase family protein YurZ
MSDALTYLLKARPEAMEHYFKFLKAAGGALDPKTRSLISVITKVHSQTARGVKQYVKRALADGATANEVLDALLMAFPALGLAKIVWAVDVLLEMDLPEFRLETLTAEPSWHRLGETSSFRPGEATRVESDGCAVFVHRAAKAWAVYDSRCPHQRTDIPLAALEGGRLQCPKHGWTFDIDSGACVSGGNRPLRRLPSKVQKGVLLAQW